MQMSLTGVVLSATGLLIGYGAWTPLIPRPMHLTLNVTIDESGPVTSVTLEVTHESAPTVLGPALVRKSSDAPPTDGGSPPGK
jgi:hypothetical protein